MYYDMYFHHGRGERMYKFTQYAGVYEYNNIVASVTWSTKTKHQ